MSFRVHTPDTAPESSRPALENIKARYGFIPNLAAVFAESPGAFNGLLAALQAYDDESLTLTPVERQVVLLAVSVQNRCEYCTAAHSMLIHMLGVGRDDVDALQRGGPLSDPKLQALRTFTEQVVTGRGIVDDASLRRFLDAGHTRGQVFEVLLGVALKTLTNYANHIARPPVNAQFERFLPPWDEAA